MRCRLRKSSRSCAKPHAWRNFVCVGNGQLELDDATETDLRRACAGGIAIGAGFSQRAGHAGGARAVILSMATNAPGYRDWAVPLMKSENGRVAVHEVGVNGMPDQFNLDSVDRSAI